MAGDVHDHNPDEDDGQIVLRARVGLEAGDLGAVAAVVVVAVGGGHGRGGGVVVVDDQGGRAASVAECEGATDACKKETKRNVTVIYLFNDELLLSCITFPTENFECFEYD